MVGVDRPASIVIRKQPGGGGEGGLWKRQKYAYWTVRGGKFGIFNKTCCTVNEDFGNHFRQGRPSNARRVVTHPVQEREVFELATERVVDGIHVGRYVDVHVVEVHRVDEHDGADYVHGHVGRR